MLCHFPKVLVNWIRSYLYILLWINQLPLVLITVAKSVSTRLFTISFGLPVPQLTLDCWHFWGEGFFTVEICWVLFIGGLRLVLVLRATDGGSSLAEEINETASLISNCFPIFNPRIMKKKETHERLLSSAYRQLRAPQRVWSCVLTRWLIKTDCNLESAS